MKVYMSWLYQSDVYNLKADVWERVFDNCELFSEFMVNNWKNIIIIKMELRY